MANSPLATVWFYNSDSGSVISEPALGDTIQAHLPGWHGPFATKQDALNYYTANKAANPSWKSPAGLGANITNTVKAPVTAAAKAVTSAIPSAFNLVFGNTTGLLTRILKVAFGGILIISGIMKMTNAKQDLIQIAGTAAKAAVV